MKKLLTIFFIAVAAIKGYSQGNPKTDAELKTLFDVIRNETAIGGNTKTRIANAYQALADSKISTKDAIVLSGTNTYTGIVTGLLTYTAFDKWPVQFTNANSGASTVNLNSLGAIPLKKSGSLALTLGDINVGQFFWLVYDGTNFQLIGGGSSGGSSLIPTAVKTANYTAATFDFIPCDITASGFTVTLPTTPADNAIIGVKIIAALGPNTLTIASGGSDVFNATGGSTKIVLTSRYQAVTLQYNASLGVWYVVNTDNKSVIDFYPDLNSTTLTATALSYGRASSGIVIVGNWAFIIGGLNAHRGQPHDLITNNQVWRAPVSNMTSWIQLSNGPFQQRSRFGCVSTGANKILVYGQDPYDCGGANCNQYRDAWLGTVNPSTGAITWTLKNAAMPMSDRFWYASFAHKGCAYLAGGICDDWPAPPTHQCAQKSTELWKSCDDGVTWSKVSQNNLWGRNNFDPADTVYGRQVYGNGVSFNNKIYMVGGGTVASNIYQRYTFDSAIWVSPDDGVTFSMIKAKLHKGVTSPAVTVADNRLYVLFGQQYTNTGVAGKPSQLIQYLDTTEAVHQVYTSIPIREDAVAATVVINGVSKIVVGLGDDPTKADTTQQFLNDLYLLSPINDKKIVYGDVAQLRTLTVDDSLMANYVNPNTVSGTLALDKFLYLQRISKTSFTAGFGTTTPEEKIDFMAANIHFGTTLGAGGANQYENYVRTNNSIKIGRLKGSAYNNVFSDVISYYAGNGDYEIYLGGTGGIGTAVLPNKIFAAVVGLDPALRILPASTTFYNSIISVAGAAAAGKAPLYIPSGTNLSTTEAGAFENNGTHLYFTFANSGTRYQLDQQAGGGGNPFADNAALVKNNADNTKLLILSAASITTGTTRTWTFPDVNGTVARSDAAQTFTGIQTLSSVPVFSAGIGSATATTQSAGDNSTKVATTAYVDGLTLGPFSSSANGYTLSSGAAGGILKYDNTWLAIGANGTVLTSNGTTFSWVAGGGGGNPFSDATAILKNNADATKLLRFDLSGFTTGTTRVLTPPNFDGTVATLAGTETFTNKTLTAPKFANTGYIADNNGNAQITFNTTASAVNNISVYNTATGTAPLLSVAGSDPNIGLTIGAKGTGPITMYTLGVLQIGGYNTLSGISADVTVSGNQISSTATATGKLILTSGGTAATSASTSGITQLLSGDGTGTNSSSGHVYINTGAKTGTGTKGNIGFFTTSGTFGGGEGVFFVADAVTNPTTNPTGGGDWFVKSSDHKPYWRTPAGVETVMLGGAAGGSVFSALTASVATNTIDNLNYANEWQWSTLAGITGLKISSTSTAAASNAQRLFEVNLSGANATSTQTTTAGYFKNTHTGTSSTNVGLYVEASGGTTNRAITTLGDIEVKSTNTTISAYQAYTDENNYEVIEIGYGRYWNDHTLEYDSKVGGSRVGGIFNIASNGTAGQLYFNTFNVNRWRVDNNGQFTPGLDNTYDIGDWAGGGKIPRNNGSYTMGVGANTIPTSTFTLTGSFSPVITSVSTNTTLTIAHYTVKVDASGANRTITLPASSGISGRVYIIKKTDSSANTVTIDGNASETIDGATTKVINTQWAGYVIQSDNTNWVIISTF